MPSKENRTNYYRVLHVQPDAPHAVVKSSYRALMKSLEMHPDRGGDHWNAVLINEAYAVLSDPVTRTEYDARLRTSTSDDPSPPIELGSGPAPTDVDPGCLFCGERRVVDELTGSTICAGCRGPRTPAGRPGLEASGRRAAQRVAREGNIRYYVSWPQATPVGGRIVDLSPLGMRFETTSTIEPFAIFKLEGPLLDAIARVATCRDEDGRVTVGAQFYTVHFHQGRGTFLSTRA